MILTFQDNQKIRDETDDSFYKFSQPLLQTAMIFLGEIICILVIHLVTKAPNILDRSMLQAVQHDNNNYSDYNDWTMPRTSTWSWSAAWFILPSACDLIATTVTSASFFSYSVHHIILIFTSTTAPKFRSDLYFTFNLSNDEE